MLTCISLEFIVCLLMTWPRALDTFNNCDRLQEKGAYLASSPGFPAGYEKTS